MPDYKPCYVVRGCNQWGKGKDATEAFINARFPEEFVVHKLPDGSKDVYVDGMGGVCWYWEDSVPMKARKSEIEEVEVDADILQSILYAASDMVIDAGAMVEACGKMGKRDIGHLEAMCNDLSGEISEVLSQE